MLTNELAGYMASALCAVLPRNERLLGQIVGLERRTSAVGRDTISHPDRGHDDVADAVAGAAALSKFGGDYTSMSWVSGDDDDSGDAWQRVRLQAFVNSGGSSDYALSHAESARHIAQIQFLGMQFVRRA